MTQEAGCGHPGSHAEQTELAAVEAAAHDAHLLAADGSHLHQTYALLNLG